MRSRRTFLLLAFAVLALALAALVVMQRMRGGAAVSTAPFPPLGPTVQNKTPRFEDFLGSQACAECHQEQYRAWRVSTHGRAGGPPTPALLLREFDGTPIRFRDAIVIPRMVGERYAFDVQSSDGQRQLLFIDGVVGGGHLVGGGTQGFFSRAQDGTMRFLPFELLREDRAWFCNTSTRANRGWVRITADMSLADCGDWPPVRVLGTSSRFASCQECHGSQIQLARTNADLPYATSYRELSINCESCHGPGRAHVELARSGRADRAANIGLVSLATLDKNGSLEVCFRCHALKDALIPGYLPGDDLEEYYSLKLPLVGNQDLQPDGRTKTFAYQQGHLYSDCYLRGSMTCVDCHEPHAQGYRDVNGRALSSRFDDGQCTACHASKALDPQAHTHHPPGTEGSRCVACHMPYLQQRDVGTQLRYARSDHTIPVPRPDWDARMEVELSCAGCHRALPSGVINDSIQRWYGALKPQRPVLAAVADVNDLKSAQRALQMALTDSSAHVMVRFNALTRYLEQIDQPDQRDLPRRLRRLLQREIAHQDADVRAAAFAALHATQGTEPRMRDWLIEQMNQLGSSAAAVRRRWSILLGIRGDVARSRADATSAVSWYSKALEVWPDQPAVLLSLGVAQQGLGDYANALRTFDRALRVDPRDVLLHINRGIVLAASGELARAEAAYADAIRVNRFEPLAYFNLANLQLRSARVAEAIANYQRAIALNPALADAHFNLARAYASSAELGAAVRALEQGLQFDAENQRARQLLEQLRAATPGN